MYDEERLTKLAVKAANMPKEAIAWLHDDPDRYDVIHTEAKKVWLKAFPKQVEHYTIPLYYHKDRQALSTDEACALVRKVIGIDPISDGNLLKLVRAVEVAHGIGAMEKI